MPSPVGPRQVGQLSATADVETTVNREIEINQRLFIVAGHPLENAGTNDFPTVGERDRLVKLSVTSLAEWYGESETKSPGRGTLDID